MTLTPGNDMKETPRISAERAARLKIRIEIARGFLKETDRSRAERIRDAMDILGITQSHLADELGIARQTLNTALNSDLILDRATHKIINISHEELPGT